MSDRNFHLHDGQTGAALAIRIIPRAKSNQVAEILNDGTIRIRLAASSGDDVNSELKAYLSNILGVSESAIDVVAGENSRDKLVSILNLSSETAQKKVIENLSK
ncbi:MAG: DUF167 domain-containing protein [Anaerolineales bacterium]|jgi:hypothetical protein